MATSAKGSTGRNGPGRRHGPRPVPARWLDVQSGKYRRTDCGIPAEPRGPAPADEAVSGQRRGRRRPGTAAAPDGRPDGGGRRPAERQKKGAGRRSGFRHGGATTAAASDGTGARARHNGAAVDSHGSAGIAGRGPAVPATPLVEGRGRQAAARRMASARRQERHGRDHEAAAKREAGDETAAAAPAWRDAVRQRRLHCRSRSPQATGDSVPARLRVGGSVIDRGGGSLAIRRCPPSLEARHEYVVRAPPRGAAAQGGRLGHRVPVARGTGNPDDGCRPPPPRRRFPPAWTRAALTGVSLWGIRASGSSRRPSLGTAPRAISGQYSFM